MTDFGKLLLELFLMFSSAKLLAEISERLHQPAVLGEIIAGVLLGPSVLALIHPNDMTRTLAEIGAIFLLFTVGLETQPRELFQVGGVAALVAVLGVGVSFLFGFVYMRSTAHDTVQSTFVAAAMVSTSVGITARVLADSGMVATKIARVILGAAVIDDILGLIVLAVVSSLSTGQIHYVQLGVVTGKAIGLTLFIAFFGPRMVRQLRPYIESLHIPNSGFILSLILCLGLSFASVYVRLAAMIGAFLAGLVMAEHSKEWHLHSSAQPIMEFMTPLFFVLLGVQLNLKTALQPGIPLTAAVVCLLGIASKLIGCGLGSFRLGWKSALKIGVGMVPRGEVSLIVAAAGLTLHTISDGIYGVVLLLSFVTTIFTPPVLRRLLKGERDLQLL